MKVNQFNFALSQCLKIPQMSHLNFFIFGIFHQFLLQLNLTCLETLFKPKASFAMLNETFSMIFKHRGFVSQSPISRVFVCV